MADIVCCLLLRQMEIFTCFANSLITMPSVYWTLYGRRQITRWLLSRKLIRQYLRKEYNTVIPWSLGLSAIKKHWFDAMKYAVEFCLHRCCICISIWICSSFVPASATVSIWGCSWGRKPHFIASHRICISDPDNRCVRPNVTCDI